MTLSSFLRIVFLLLILGSLAGLPYRAQPRSSSGNGAPLQTEPNQIVFTVVDKDSHLVDTLQAADVRLIEDNQPQQIISFRRVEERPKLLAILIDNSLSQEKTLPSQKSAADSFVQAVLRSGKDQAAVVTFTGRITIEQGLTNDMPLVRQAISRVRFHPPKGYMGVGVVVQGPPPSAAEQVNAVTAIWDAVWETTEQLLASATPEYSKAIILLTDGEDTASKRKMHEAVEQAFAANVSVFAIGIGERGRFGINEGALRKISERTGGRAFIPKKAETLASIFAEIQAGLTAQYQITYQSSAKQAQAQRRVHLEIINPSLRAKDFRIPYQRVAAGK